MLLAHYKIEKLAPSLIPIWAYICFIFIYDAYYIWFVPDGCSLTILFKAGHWELYRESSMFFLRHVQKL